MPVWFIVQVAKPPGVVVLVWQDSHAAVVTIWFAGLTIAMVVTVVPTLTPEVWQLAHPVVMPVWFIAGLGTAKPPVLVLVMEWHVSQLAEVVIWFVGLPNTTVVPTVAPVWQLAQPVVIPAWLIVQFLKPPGVVVSLWQVSHGAVVAIWLAGLPNTTVFLEPTVPPVWQLAQPAVIPVWLIVQFTKPPGVEVSV